jgi:hypothetical protein
MYAIKHVIYKDGDKDIPSVITDSNGQVVLDLCILCGKGEAELDLSTECEGMNKSGAMAMAILNKIKMTHSYFTASEYIQSKNGSLCFEDEIKIPLDWWNKDYLSKGWSIYKEQ